MSSKRPSNGPNLTERRSNLRSKGRKWKEQLVQGVKEKEIKDALMARLEEQRALQKDIKQKHKEEARELSIALGFVDPEAEKSERKVPEWKKQKIFINATFPPPVICRKFKDQIVYRNKLLMQEYLHRVATEEEWENNVALLAEMREIYDAQHAEQPAQKQANEAEVSDEEGQDENGQEEEDQLPQDAAESAEKSGEQGHDVTGASTQFNTATHAQDCGQEEELPDMESVAI